MNETHGWWATDLLGVAALTAAIAFGIQAGLPGPVRLLLALPLVVFLPGYALTAVAFPAANGFDPDRVALAADELRSAFPADYELSGVSRVGLSVVSSAGLVPLVAFVVNFTPWPISLRPLLLGVAGLTVGLVAVAAARRLQLPTERRFVLSLDWLGTTGVGLSPHDAGRVRWANVAIVVSLLLVASGVGYALVSPPQGERFTEFYVATGNVTGQRQSFYHESFTRGEATPVTVVVSNHERRVTQYTVVAALQQVTYNGSARTVWYSKRLDQRSLSVGANQTRRETFRVRPARSGSRLRLVFLLYRGDPPAELTVGNAYRVLDLGITVADGGTAGDRGFVDPATVDPAPKPIPARGATGQ